MAQRTHLRAIPGTIKIKSFARLITFQEYKETGTTEPLVRLMGITEVSLSEKYKDLPAQRHFGDPEEEVCWHFFLSDIKGKLLKLAPKPPPPNTLKKQNKTQTTMFGGSLGGILEATWIIVGRLALTHQQRKL